MPTLFDSHEQFAEWFSKGVEGSVQEGGALNEHQLQRLHQARAAARGTPWRGRARSLLSAAAGAATVLLLVLCGRACPAAAGGAAPR